jgi:hypothetical protein
MAAGDLPQPAARLVEQLTADSVDLAFDQRKQRMSDVAAVPFGRTTTALL